MGLHTGFASKYDFRININHLFDRDERFLYENPYFKAVLRKVKNKHSELVNPAFDIEQELLEPNPKYDDT